MLPSLRTAAVTIGRGTSPPPVAKAVNFAAVLAFIEPEPNAAKNKYGAVIRFIPKNFVLGSKTPPNILAIDQRLVIFTASAK